MADAFNRRAILSADEVTTDKLKEDWPFIEPFIARALDRGDGRYSLEDIKHYLIDGVARAWLIEEINVLEQVKEIKACFVLELMQYPQLLVCNVLALAGKDIEQWLPFVEAAVEDIARNQDAKRIEIIGRLGWKRILKPLGYRETACFLAKEL